MGFLNTALRYAPMVLAATGNPTAAMAAQAANQMFNKKSGPPQMANADPSNPYAGVNGTLSPQAIQEALKNLQPYITAGHNAQNVTQPIYQSRAQDPGAFMNNLMRGYSSSRGFDMRRNAMMQAMQNSQNAAGLSGTPSGMQEQGEMANSLLNGDMMDYLKQLLGIQDTGLSGLGGIAERGYNASGLSAEKFMQGLTGRNEANVAGQHYMNMAQNYNNGIDYQNRQNAFQYGNKNKYALAKLLQDEGVANRLGYDVDKYKSAFNSARGFF